MSEWRRTTNGRREVSYDNTTWWPEEHDTAILAYQAERKEQADALSVLRDLVALHYEKYTGKDVTWVTDRMAHEDIVWARARSLVAEHTPDEERQ